MSDENCINENVIGGDMLKRTAWAGRIGWLAFIFTLAFFFFYIVLQSVKETPILAYDRETGRILGEIVWSDRPRSIEEITLDIKKWGSAFLSQNSETIFEETSIALSAMDEKLRQRVMGQWESEEIVKVFGTNYLAYIRDLQQEARVEYKQEGGVTVAKDEETGTYSARLVGDIVIDPEVGNEAGVIPFDSTVIFKTVNYSKVNTLGLKIQEVVDN